MSIVYPSAVQASITMLEIPSILWAIWSFQLHKTLWKSDMSAQQKQHQFVYNTKYAKQGFFEHVQNGVLYSSVCPFGKFGAWVILLWTIALITSIYTLSGSNLFIIFIVQNIIIGLIFILSLFMNYPLWIRTLPFFYLQIIVSFLLLSLSTNSIQV